MRPSSAAPSTARRYGDLLIKPDLEKARRLLKESGYDGTPVAMLQQTDLRVVQPGPGRRQAATREGRLQDRPVADGLADRGVAPRPQARRRRRAAGTSSSRPTSRSTSTIPAPTPTPPALATRRGSAGRAIPRSKSCAPPSSGESDPDQAKGDRACDLRPRGRPGLLCAGRPVQGLRRLSQGPPLGLAGRPGARWCGTSAKKD